MKGTDKIRHSVTIKLKPYLGEYLQCKLSEPVIASKKNIVGAMLFPLLQQRPKEETPVFNRGKGYFDIELPTYNNLNVTRGNIYISNDNQKVFQGMLDAHFDDILFNYLDDKVRTTRKIKKWIYEFCAMYNIRFDSVTYETLKKKYYRVRKKREEIAEKVKKSGHKLSLSCPSILTMLL